MERFEEVKLQVKEANELASVVEEYLPLRRRGRTLVALCPFHQEKTPSFTIFTDTQHFKCFGCQKAGDVFTFVMEREAWSFREAFEWLAERAGIDTSGAFGAREPARPRVDVHGVLSEVRRWACRQLGTEAGAAARRYLESRGLSGAVEDFGIGYHPPAPSLSRYARDKSLVREVLEQAGLLVRGREPFAGRILFPIEDERGRTVGFGGRLIGDGEPKYINSPESPFFNKRRLLFGLRRAKQSGVRRLVVMEGYTDVISCHLAGFGGAVATLGTALTLDHARLLERYASDGTVLLFDGDEAGRRAAERAFAELQNSRLELSIALVDEGVDPADLVAPLAGRTPADLEAGRARLQALLDSAESATAVWFRLLRRRYDLDQAVQVERAAAECGGILRGVDNDLRRDALLQEMARHLGVSPRNLGRMVGRVRPARPAREAASSEPREPGAGPASGTSPLHSAELDLIACLLAHPPLAGGLSDPGLTDGKAGSLLGWLAECVEAGETTREGLCRALFSRCAERPDLAAMLSEAVDRSARIAEPEAVLETLLRGRQAYLSRRQARDTRRRLQQALSRGDRQLADELTQLYVEQLRQT